MLRKHDVGFLRRLGIKAMLFLTRIFARSRFAVGALSSLEFYLGKGRVRAVVGIFRER